MLWDVQDQGKNKMICRAREIKAHNLSARDQIRLHFLFRQIATLIPELKRTGKKLGVTSMVKKS